MEFGAIVIGDEILSGRRADKHITHVIQWLGEKHLGLKWARIVGDEPALLVETFRQTYASECTVFCFGGLGATPDDLTRQMVAEASGLDLRPHPEAVTAIEQQFGKRAYPNRILMAELPVGSEIIPNPVNNVPGFSLRGHYFMPGFPQMAWPMMDWIWEHKLAQIAVGRKQSARVFYVYDVGESDILDYMRELLAQFADVALSSLPTIQPDHPRIEIQLKGEGQSLENAYAFFTGKLNEQKIMWEDKAE
jgi:molybdopterin-biosynthesis enzyme MoeA-like protein